MNDSTNRLLIIDDEPDIRDFLITVAKGLGFAVCDTDDPHDFHTLCEKFAPTAVILDLNMPKTDGVELLRRMADEQCEAHILLISGEGTRVLQAAERLGNARGLSMIGALQKPILLTDLRDALTKAQSAQRAVTANELSQAIELEQLVVHYQPKIAHSEPGGWSIESAESLVRWNHPQLGLLMPDAFIPLAEETGLMRPLTNYVLQQTVEQLRAWQVRGLTITAAVNVGPQLLTELEFPDRLEKLLKKYGLKNSKITLEITETVAMQDQETGLDILTRLRLKGFDLAIDDFGTGYSSLKQLFYMPFSELKIDISFVIEVAQSSEARTLVAAMIQLAHNLDMRACCEGVESQEILDLVVGMGCDTVQGYFFSRPVTAVAFEKFVCEWDGRVSDRPPETTPDPELEFI